MRPYSKDVRSRVLAAVDRGTSREEAARTFSVSVPTIKRGLKRRRETGDVEPKPIVRGPLLFRSNARSRAGKSDIRASLR